MLEEWSGSRLLPTFVYGIRRYLRGAQLKIHRDQEFTHIISAVLNITQDVDEDWHLHIDDHFFRRHKVTLSPGEMLIYEGQNLAHGRPEPLNGSSYNNIFVHYKPAAAPPEPPIIGSFYQDPQQCDADCLRLVGSTCRVVNRDGVTGYICLAPK